MGEVVLERLQGRVHSLRESYGVGFAGGERLTERKNSAGGVDELYAAGVEMLADLIHQCGRAGGRVFVVGKKGNDGGIYGGDGGAAADLLHPIRGRAGDELIAIQAEIDGRAGVVHDADAFGMAD